MLAAGGLGILWIIIIVVVVLAIAWYFMRGRGTA
jgi:hypothetical protein